MIVRLKAWSILIIMGMGWGLTFSLGRIAAVGGVHPLSITFWEAAIAAILLVAFSVAGRRRIPVSGELILLYIAAGLLGLVLPATIFYYAAAHAPAGVLSICVAILPILTFLAAALLGREAFILVRVAGIVLGTGAIILLVGPEQSLPDPAQVPWVLFCLLAPVCYAALNIMLDCWTPRGATPFTTTVGMFVASAVIMIPILYVTSTFVSFGWPWQAVEWSMFGLGFIAAVAFSMYFHLIETAGPVFTSQTANLVTLFGVIWGIVIFGEQNSIWVWLSLATMMVALSLVTPRQKLASMA